MKEKDKEKINLNRLRTELSIKQTLYASKRTLLSYISTACVFVSLAFTYLKISSINEIDIFVIIMLCVGIVFFVFGLIEYIISKKQMKVLFQKYHLEAAEEEIDREDEQKNNTSISGLETEK